MNYLIHYNKYVHLHRIMKVAKNGPYSDDILSLTSKLADAIDDLYSLVKRSRSDIYQRTLHFYITSTITVEEAPFEKSLKHIRKVAQNKSPEFQNKAEEACQLLIKMRKAIHDLDVTDERDKLLSEYGTEYIAHVAELQKAKKLSLLGRAKNTSVNLGKHTLKPSLYNSSSDEEAQSDPNPTKKHKLRN